MVKGSYRYLLNGQPTDVLESWEIEGQWNTDCRVSSRRLAPGVEIEVTATLSRGVVQSFDTQWRSGLSPADTAGTVSARYQLRDDQVLVRWCGAGSDGEELVELAHDANKPPALLFPLMRIFTGPLITRLLERGGVGDVVLPSIGDPADTPNLLRPQCSERTARVVAQEQLQCADGVERLLRRCEYTGDQYTSGSYFWLGEDEVLERYQWQQSPDLLWDVWLQRQP